MEHCKTPCNDCPFRKNSLAGWLGEYSAQDLHMLVMSERPFPCHMTHADEDLDWDEAGTKENPLCAGALLFMKKSAKMPRDPELAKILKSFDYSGCDNILSVTEFYKHHTES